MAALLQLLLHGHTLLLGPCCEVAVRRRALLGGPSAAAAGSAKHLRHASQGSRVPGVAAKVEDSECAGGGGGGEGGKGADPGPSAIPVRRGRQGH